jgi:Uma2 family endonuclease
VSDFVYESVAAYGAPRRKMTVDEYYRAAEIGIFDPDEKLELIWGEVVELSPQQSRHATVTALAREVLRSAFPDSALREHSPLRLDQHNEPEPDLLVVKGPLHRYASHHPSAPDVLLVVEVADSSLRKDRKLKTALYAGFGIPEYWIVDLTSNRLEIYRDPEAAAEQGKAGYKLVQTLSAADSVVPLLGNGEAVQLGSILIARG